METNTRICRALVEAAIGRPEMNRRQRLREERILAAGQLLMARYGRHGITFRMLAGALRIATQTLAWHYTDLDALLGEILRTYLQTLHTVLGAVAFDSPNRQPELRAAYLKAIQGPFGGLTPLHVLLTRDRLLLSADERADIDPTLQGLGELLAGDLGPEALDLLERPWMDHPQAEALLATIAALRAQSPSPELPGAEPPTPETAPENVLETPEAPEAISPTTLDPTDPEPPQPRAWVHFDIQDIPLPVPGSLAAMTDAELDAADAAAAADADVAAEAPPAIMSSSDLTPLNFPFAAKPTRPLPAAA
jgi:AcrR family transcriptional regulator